MHIPLYLLCYLPISFIFYSPSKYSPLYTHICSRLRHLSNATRSFSYGISRTLTSLPLISLGRGYICFQLKVPPVKEITRSHRVLSPDCSGRVGESCNLFSGIILEVPVKGRLSFPLGSTCGSTFSQLWYFAVKDFFAGRISTVTFVPGLYGWKENCKKVSFNSKNLVYKLRVGGHLFCQPHHDGIFHLDPIEIYPIFVSSDYVGYSFRSIGFEQMNFLRFCFGVKLWGTNLTEICLSPNSSWSTLWTVHIDTLKSELILIISSKYPLFIYF